MKESQVPGVPDSRARAPLEDWKIGSGGEKKQGRAMRGRRQPEIDESWLEAEVWGKRQAVGWPMYTVYSISQPITRLLIETAVHCTWWGP